MSSRQNTNYGRHSESYVRKGKSHVRRSENYARHREVDNEDDGTLFEEGIDFPEWLNRHLEFNKRRAPPLMKKPGFFSSALKAFSRKNTDKSTCLFSIHLHGVEGLPKDLNGTYVLVSLSRKEQSLETRPVLVMDGVAEIEQTLQVRCTLYSSKGPGLLQFDSKYCSISTLIEGVKRIEIGKHELDLTKILPLNPTSEQVPWTSNLPLTGRGRGAVSVVTFGYEVDNGRGVKMAAKVDPRTFASFSAIASAQESPEREPLHRRSISDVSDSRRGEISAALEELMPKESRTKGEEVKPVPTPATAAAKAAISLSSAKKVDVTGLKKDDAEEETKGGATDEEDDMPWTVSFPDDSAARGFSISLDEFNLLSQGLMEEEEEEAVAPASHVRTQSLTAPATAHSLSRLATSSSASNLAAVSAASRKTGSAVEGRANSGFASVKDRWKSMDASSQAGSSSQPASKSSEDKQPTGIKARIAALNAQKAAEAAQQPQPQPPKIGKVNKPSFLQSEVAASVPQPQQQGAKVGRISKPSFLQSEELVSAPQSQQQGTKIGKVNKPSFLQSDAGPSVLAGASSVRSSFPAPSSRGAGGTVAGKSSVREVAASSESEGGSSKPIGRIVLPAFLQKAEADPAGEREAPRMKSVPGFLAPARTSSATAATLTTADPPAPGRLPTSISLGGKSSKQSAQTASMAAARVAKPVPKPKAVSESEEEEDFPWTVSYGSSQTPSSIAAGTNSSAPGESKDGMGELDDPLMDELVAMLDRVSLSAPDVQPRGEKTAKVPLFDPVEEVEERKPRVVQRSVFDSVDIDDEPPHQSAHVSHGSQKPAAAAVSDRQKAEAEKEAADAAAEQKRVAERERASAAAAAAAAKEKAAAEKKRIAEEERIVEEKRIAEERIAEEKRIAEEERIAEEKAIAEKRRIAEEEKIIAEQKRAAEEERAAAAAAAAAVISEQEKAAVIAKSETKMAGKPPLVLTPALIESRSQLVPGFSRGGEEGMSDSNPATPNKSVDTSRREGGAPGRVELWNMSPRSVGSEDLRVMETFLSHQRSRSPSPAPRQPHGSRDQEYDAASSVGDYREAGEDDLDDDDDDYDDDYDGEDDVDWQDDEEDDSEMDSGLAGILEAAQEEHEKALQLEQSRQAAIRAEQEEAEELMRKLGLDPETFDIDNPAVPIIPSAPEAAYEAPPPLAEGFDSAMHTSDGGMLFSMAPDNFVADEARLVMQISKPIVIPEGVGHTATEIAQHFATLGGDVLSEQAHMLMPMDDITNKSMAQIFSEGIMSMASQNQIEGGPQQSSGRSIVAASSAIKKSKQDQALSMVTTRSERGLSPSTMPMEFVSLDELAPLAIPALEQLAMQGLQVQTGMASENPPAVIDPFPASSKKKSSAGTAGKKAAVSSSPAVSQPSRVTLQEMSKGDSVNNLPSPSPKRRGGNRRSFDSIPASPGRLGSEWDGLDSLDGLDIDAFLAEDGLGMSLDDWELLNDKMLEDWADLDASLDLGGDAKDSLSVDAATSSSLVVRESGGASRREESDKKRQEGAIVVSSSGSGQVAKAGQAHFVQTAAGSTVNTVTLAIMVQLRNPYRNNEPVGAPMMALVQAERVVVSMPVKLGRPYNLNPKGRAQEEEEQEGKQLVLVKDGRSQFRITGVHMLGLEGDTGVSKGWGSQKQKQAGSRWLLASGMSKGPTKSALAKQRRLKEESVWSLSQKLSGAEGGGSSKGKESGFSAFKSPVMRNADIRLKKK